DVITEPARNARGSRRQRESRSPTPHVVAFDVKSHFRGCFVQGQVLAAVMPELLLQRVQLDFGMTLSQRHVKDGVGEIRSGGGGGGELRADGLVEARKGVGGFGRQVEHAWGGKSPGGGEGVREGGDVGEEAWEARHDRVANVGLGKKSVVDGNVSRQGNAGCK